MSTTATPDVSTPQPRSLGRKILSALKLTAINFLIFAVMAEVVSLIFVHMKRWPSTRPSYHLTYNEFWADLNPVFGVWHRPNGRFLHQEGCFSVEYTTNSYGARDAERSLHSSQPRTVVLGDSFVEGLGLPDQDRLSNILEKRTGHEHLNFGTGGSFGPLQYALLYKSMASKFDHDEVLVGVLPDNDFKDMDRKWGAQNDPDRYRPYYADDFSIVYQGHFDPKAGEGWGDHAEAFMRAYLASYHVGQYIYYSLLYWPTRGVYSGYNDWNAVDLERLQHALLDIKSTADAHGAKVHVFLIPRANDFLRLHEKGTNRLGPVIEAWGKEVGIPIRDLLPDMEARGGKNYRSYFLPCDGHWSAHGNEVAADILQPWVYGN